MKNDIITFCNELLDQFNNLDFYLTTSGNIIYPDGIIETISRTYDYEWLKNDLQKCIELDEMTDDNKNINLWINFTYGLIENKYNMNKINK